MGAKGLPAYPRIIFVLSFWDYSCMVLYLSDDICIGLGLDMSHESSNALSVEEEGISSTSKWKSDSGVKQEQASSDDKYVETTTICIPLNRFWSETNRTKIVNGHWLGG